ncbi:tyrosine-type recombinase/integrase [Pseudorhodoplanes sinuspersici]
MLASEIFVGTFVGIESANFQDTNMALTDTNCRNAKARSAPYKLSDGGGLHLLVAPSGARYWRLAYRWMGKQRTLALGVYPAVSLASARDARDEAKRNLAAGSDPSAVKRASRRAAKLSADNTFEAVARDWHDVWKSGRTEFYATQVMRRLQADVLPEIGQRPISEIEPPELLDLLRKVEKRGVHETARRLHQLIGQIFRFAVITGKAKRNPAADLKGALRATGEPKRHKMMPRADLPVFLRSLENDSGEPRTRLALKLVTLTFLRTTELRGGKWSELENLEDPSALWRIPAERMKMRKEHLVPLSRQAVEVIRELRRLSGISDFMFPSPGKEGYMSNNTMLYALYRLGYHGRATTHGFRSLASTILNEHNFNRDWIERQLAHVERNEVRRAYNAAEWLQDRRDMMQWWADYLDRFAMTETKAA